MVVEFEAGEAGTYMLEHAIDEADASVPIHVVLGAAPGAEAQAS
jgi:hypothetical protein